MFASPITAAFCSPLAAGIFDQNAPHRLSGGAEEVLAIVEVSRAVGSQKP
jgi:hypothetical protein